MKTSRNYVLLAALSGVFATAATAATLPAHGVSAANIKVVQNDTGNTTNSVTCTTPTSINGLQVLNTANRGDYNVQVGAALTDDFTNGVFITSVSENGRDNGEGTGTNYCTSAISGSTNGYFIPVSSAPGGAEYNINVAAAFFPYGRFLAGYARNSAGTAGATNNLLTASPGLVLGTHFVDNGGGTSTVNLASFGINSQTDGILFATGGGNNNDYASVQAVTNGTWKIYIRDNGSNQPFTVRGPVAFAFVPKTNAAVISGKFSGSGSILMYNGATPRFSVTNTATGIWQLSIPGHTPTNGVLVISAEGGLGYNMDNIVSSQPSGNNWLIQSRDIPGLGLQTPTGEPVVSFVYIPTPNEYAWSGGGTNGNWSTGDNWDGAAPVSGNELVFSGAARLVNTNNLSGLSVPSLTFNSGGFSLYGNAFTNTGSVSNRAGINTLKAPLTWNSTAAKIWHIASGSELVLDNTTTVADVGDHSVVGGGTLRQIGTVNFTATPAFAINEGKHIINGGVFNTIGGYRVGTGGTGAGAQTILTNGASLTITAGGGSMRVGDSTNPIASRLDLYNSTLTMAGGVRLTVPNAAGASGIINQTGGTVNSGILSFSDAGAGTGSYTIKNGTLVAKQIRENTASGSASIYFDNAIVRTDPAAVSDFMTGLDVAQIQAGGLTVDATTLDITIGQALSGSGALTKTGGNMVTLTGANTFTGNTTISAGTLAVGTGGAIASPSITLANGTTLDVSAVSFTFGASQTLVRNASSGTANVVGNLTLASGAQISLQADGSGTVGPVAVTGNLTANGNTLSINVNASSLGAGTYPLITYTGAKTGSFNATPVITGAGVAAGCLSEIQETTGQINLRVYTTSRVWSGGGTDDNWSTALNWDGVVPVAGDKLTFSGATRLASINDLSGLSVASVSFSSGGFAISGNGLTVTGGVTNSTGNNAINAGLTLGGAARLQSDAGTLTVGAVSGGANNLTVDGAGNTTASGVLSGTGSVTKNGTGLLQFSGGSANTYSGGTVVNAGTLSLAKSAGVNAIAGNITVGDGAGGAGADGVRLDAANQIPDSATVTVSASGLFNLNNASETVGAISGVSGSQIALGSGALTVANTGAAAFAGIISGSGQLVKEGAGTLTLSGANTFTGNTTISAGTLALGAGGSIANSPAITIGTGTTLNVSAVGFTLGASQTIVRNSTSGVGTVSGNMAMAAGAQISLQGNGTLGTLHVAGNLTLNGNALTINFTGGSLAVGTYPLITYTGTKSGSFNATPTLIGSGLGLGLAAKIVETTGVISLKVFVPAHGVAAASLKVVENDLGNTTNSVTVTTSVSINGLQMRDGSSRGDYFVQVGASATDDLANGVLLTSVAENGRDHGEDSGISYCTSAIMSSGGGYYIPTASAPDGAEYNINVSAAYFPYAKFLGGYARNSAGTNGGPNDLLTASPGLVLGTHFVDNGGGTSTVNLASFGINSQTDGILLVTGGANNNDYAASEANANGTWTVFIKDNGSNSTAMTQGPVAFAFVPKTNVSVISGKFGGDGSILLFNGTSPRFSVTNLTNGVWQLGIPGYSSSQGVLLISAEGGQGYNQDNIVSAQPSGTNWLIHSRDIPGLGLQTPTGEPVVSFVFIPGPTATLVSPANNVTNIASSPTLTVTPNHNGAGNLNVTFYGRELPRPGPGRDFLIPVLPDTQRYAAEACSDCEGSGQPTKEMWFAQTQWIATNRVSQNIPFVATLGDCVNTGTSHTQWKNATNAYYRLEKQSTTELLDGIPYGVTVGNHDQDTNGEQNSPTVYYNQYFGISHFDDKAYYGGHYSTNNDNWFVLFSVSGLDFIVISFEFNRYDTAIFNWARAVLATNQTRRVIVLTHAAGNDVSQSSNHNTVECPWLAQGQAIYTNLRTNGNFFLMMSGHVYNVGGEGRRSDTYNGKTVHTLVSDYQGRDYGGGGLMRLMYFSPSNNLVSVKTYTPYYNTNETDNSSQFTFSYNMQPNGAGTPGTAYAAKGTNANVVPGAPTSILWTGLTANRPYAWYVTVTDENGDYATSVEWNFKTTSGYSNLVAPPPDANGNGIPDSWEAAFGISDANADADGDGQNNYAEYVANTNPTNAASALRIIGTSSDVSGQVTLIWASVGGVRYRIQRADSADGSFADVERDATSETDPRPLGTAATQSYTEPAAATNTVRFYRVKVVP